MIMDDRAEIAALLDRHQLCIDLRDNDGFASVYTEDARTRARLPLRAAPRNSSR
jgi:hypothetical protein